MNKYLLIIFLSALSYSQEITVNEKKYITLLFNTNIVSGIVSSDDYILEYNDSEEDNMALIKAKRANAEETNIIIKTKNGFIFNLNVNYGINKKNIIKIDDSLGVSSTITTKKIVIKSNDPVNDDTVVEQVNENIRENDYTIGNIVINDNENQNYSCDICSVILESKKSIKRIFSENYDIKAQLNNVYYNNSKLYFVINVINDSDIDYSFNYIKSYIETNNDNKVSTTQYLEKNPVSIYNVIRTIKAHTNRILIFVYEQFSIDNNKKIVFEMNENNGERNLFLKIPHYLSNNPKPYTK